jgi:hypothetical protein
MTASNKTVLDLIGLKASLFKASQFLYYADGTPRLDRVVTTAKEKNNDYSTKIPNELPRISISEALADYQAFE